ncbi:MAG: GDSL-type esterase/lipase family protein [Deltaproteobacteria bacterium]|nr:GDSL-type esterase/lipase family protein [Deltaproteobacteria bacterium]
MTTGSTRPSRSILRNLALAAGSLAVFLILAEGIATLLLRSDGEPRPGIADAATGFRLRGKHTYTEVGGALVRTNSRGFREAEIVTPRPPGGPRVLALGDSSTFGYGVSPEESYPERLEQALAARLPGRSVEVINAGTPGWSSGNGLGFLVSEGLSWKPDIVLVSFGYNEQLGSGPGAPHYDYDARESQLWVHAIGDAQRSRVAPPVPDDAMPAPRFSDRFRDFPRNVRFYLLLQHGIHLFRQGSERVWGGLKSSRLASRVLAMAYRREPELIYRPLRVHVEHNHVLEAYVTHLEETVRRCRQTGAAVIFVLQPRRAYQELLHLLPAPEREANLRAATLVEAGKSGEAVALLALSHAARPEDAVTTYQLALALQLDGQDARALALLNQVLSLRPFTMNALMQQVSIGLGVPIVPTPLSFMGSAREDLFFPDRYHTREAGYALVVEDIERTLAEEGMMEGREAGPE